MTVPETLVVESLGDSFDVFGYADLMDSTPEGHIYLTLLHDVARDARRYAHAHFDVLP